MLTLEYRDISEEKSQIFIEKLQKKLQENITNQNIVFLKSSRAFRKNNSYHSSLIIK